MELTYSVLTKFSKPNQINLEITQQSLTEIYKQNQLLIKQ